MSFISDLKRATKNIKEDRDKIVRGTLIGLSNRIIRRTPVGDPDLWASDPPPGYVGGTLRGAWNASFGSPDFTITNRIEKSQGGATAADAAKVISNLKIGSHFYLTNPQPYAERVENGWSTQRPQGMLKVSVTEAQQAFKRAAK